MKYNYPRLEQNISDTIYEGIVKIGYLDEKAISVYYNMDLLSYLLDIRESMTKEKWKECLQEFKEYTRQHFGEVKIKRQKDRFEFLIPADGVAYIHNNNSGRKFLNQLIRVMRKKNCAIDEVIEVFRKVSEHVVISQINHDEFQYIIKFQDKSIDEFNYCFTFNEMGHYFHRLLDYDLQKVLDGKD